MRFFGAAAVMLACSCMALSLIRAERRRLLCLEGLCFAADRMRAELSTSLSPTRQLLQTAACAAGGEAGAFFREVCDRLPQLNERSFPEIWNEAAACLLPSLSGRQREALARLGGTLGRYELSEQLSALDRYAEESGEELARMRREYPQKRRLIAALSETAGVFLCLLLL